jgi:hypothetical protein
MCSEISISIGFAHKLSHLPTKDVMHNASALLKVVQAGQQGPDRGLGMLGVQLLYFFIRQICQGCEQLCQVAAHVGVRAVPHRQIWDLGKALSHRRTISTVLELWLAQATNSILQTHSTAQTHIDKSNTLQTKLSSN